MRFVRIKRLRADGPQGDRTTPPSRLCVAEKALAVSTQPPSELSLPSRVPRACRRTPAGKVAAEIQEPFGLACRSRKDTLPSLVCIKPSSTSPPKAVSNSLASESVMVSPRRRKSAVQVGLQACQPASRLADLMTIRHENRKTCKEAVLRAGMQAC